MTKEQEDNLLDDSRHEDPPLARSAGSTILMENKTHIEMLAADNARMRSALRLITDTRWGYDCAVQMAKTALANESSYAQLRDMVQRARGLIENGKFDSPSEADDWITDAVVILSKESKP